MRTRLSWLMLVVTAGACSSVTDGDSSTPQWHSVPAAPPAVVYHASWPTGDALADAPKVHHAAPLGSSRMLYASSDLISPALLDVTIVTDPDHDSVWLGFAGTMTQIELNVGEEPGDIVVGQRFSATGEAQDVAYVSLHNGGAILSIPLWSAPQFTYTRLPVCASPQGMDSYPQGNGASFIYVACADGVLVTLNAQDDTVISTLPLADDLKDVVVVNGASAFVTQFRTANVLWVDLSADSVIAAQQIPSAMADRSADVAWQMVPIGGTYPRTGALIVHQLASTAPINVEPAPPVPSPPVATDGGFCACVCDDGTCSETAGVFCDDGTLCSGSDGGTCGEQNGYGPPPPGCFNPSAPDTPQCSVGVVAAAATIVLLPAGSSTSPTFIPAGVMQNLIPPLTVIDVPDADGPDDEALVLGIGSGSLATFDVSKAVFSGAQGTSGCLTSESAPPGAVALAMSGNSSTSLFIPQAGSTAASVFSNVDIGTFVLPFQPISGEAGRDLFHSATPSLMSCASCHPHGRDDSHIWNFIPMGLRRTPSLGGGLLATAPFHWDGSEKDIAQLMNDVFVGRMEGSPPTAEQVTEISDWLNGLPVAYAHSAPDPGSAARGKALFESSDVGCTNCHSGEHFTNNLTLDVGTGGAFQVPSLLGVGSRAPYLHDGRAADLVDRFNPTLGGGDAHGQTSQLTPAQIDDLVSYLRSL